MLISRRHRVIFLANPKCGSQSVRAALLEVPGVEEPDLHLHACLRSVEAWLDEPLSDYFVFTTARDPWERVVSIYHFGMKIKASVWHLPAIESGSVSAFCFHPTLEWLYRPKEGDESWTEGPYDLPSFCSDISGSFRARVFDIRDVARLEACLAERDIRITVPNINRTNHGPYADYYDERSAARVAFLFEKDIALMGYRSPLALPLGAP